MSGKTIALGADHGGYETKQRLSTYLRGKGHKVVDMGTTGTESADYPIFGFRVAQAVSREQVDFGVLVCRSGNGMSMAANKVRGVRAAIATNKELAALARQHNDANILIMGSDFLDDPSEAVLDAFLDASPEDGRHARRVDMINHYDEALGSSLPPHQLYVCGQSVWLDDISDTLIASGELARLVNKDGIRGVTSNPAIFEKAINSGEGRYKAELAELKKKGTSAEEAYEILTVADIASVADILRPLYDETGGDDGYVSYEVLPGYAHDEEKTVQEAIRLFAKIGRPNVMIKIPATPEGIRAFRRVTAEGVNVNVTLIFSTGVYRDVARAYIQGLAERRANGGDVSRVRSVASVFVSRIDAAVDKKLTAVKTADPSKAADIDTVLNKIAIANTKIIYDDFKTIFYGEEFAELAAIGAIPQRPLWASTGVKDPAMRDTVYVEELVGAMTVNTIPGPTVKALLDHGRIRPDSVEENMDEARAAVAKLAKFGIDLDAECDELQKVGVKLFCDAFDKLFAAIKAQL